MPDILEPWPHGILDDFLPAEVFGELLEALPGITGGPNVQKVYELPASVTAILNDETVLNAIRQRHWFQGGHTNIEAVYRRSRLEAHSDRKDKLWSGLIYLAGDPKGTEFYGADGKLAKTVEWKPNRLVCWSLRRSHEQHAVPVSDGRWVLAWWILTSKIKGK